MTAPLHHLVAAARVDPLKVFIARAEARALLYAIGEFSLHKSVDVLQRDAECDGLVDKIGQDAIQKILAAAFHRAREASR